MPLLTALYVFCALLLTVHAIGSVTLLLTYLRVRNRPVVLPPMDESDPPMVALQLPIYNEKYVVERLLDAVAALDWRRDRLIIQVLDDSSDETVAAVAAHVERLQAQGIQIQHVCRDHRQGYKAGALAYGLEQLRNAPIPVEFVAVLDADFIPFPDFLKLTVPHLVARPELGMVQARWGHLNTFDSLLTMGQTLALDAHFVVEQTARNRAGWLINFNGTGGVWRVRAIEEAGGWKDGTLTEDLDLSYRAQLKGWRFLYLPDVIVPGELPPQIAAYKQQQARWSKGGTQCLTLLIRPIWRSRDLSLMQRLMATMHLAQYLAHPTMIVLLLLTPLMIASGSESTLPLGPLGLAGLGPPLIFIISQQALHRDWKRRILVLPALIALGTGIAWSNARAVVSGLLGVREEFKRTPKFSKAGSSYSLPLNPNIKWEVVFMLYSLWGLVLSWQFARSLTPYLAIYCIGFGSVAFWGLRDHWRTRQSVRRAAKAS